MRSLPDIVQRVANRCGLHVIRVSPHPTADAPYRPVRPSATYCPWNLDEGFRAAFAAVRDATLVDKYRCFELWQLVAQTSSLPSGALLEVGVWRGGTGALIAQRAADCGVSDTVYLCDTFRGVAKAGAEDSSYRGGEHADTSVERVERLIRGRMGLTNFRVIEGVFPDETGSDLNDESFRFCHIDVDTYESARDTAEWVWERLVPGGVVVFDDYGFKACDGVTRYANEQMDLPDRLAVHNLNGHAIFVKR